MLRKIASGAVFILLVPAGLYGFGWLLASVIFANPSPLTASIVAGAVAVAIIRRLLRKGEREGRLEPGGIYTLVVSVILGVLAGSLSYAYGSWVVPVLMAAITLYPTAAFVAGNILVASLICSMLRNAVRIAIRNRRAKLAGVLHEALRLLTAQAGWATTELQPTDTGLGFAVPDLPGCHFEFWYDRGLCWKFHYPQADFATDWGVIPQKGSRGYISIQLAGAIASTCGQYRSWLLTRPNTA